MPNYHFLKQLREGKVLIGLCNTYPAAGIVEGMCKGWDFVWIDGQHGQMSYDSVLAAVRAADVIGVETVVRVPGHEYGLLGPIADMAPSAIMVPMVNTAAEAREVVDALSFAPRGRRSFGGRRVVDLQGRDYHLETELAIVAQIETEEAVDNVDAISRTDGIDVLFYGADDMKVSLGLPIQTAVTDNQQLAEAMHKVVGAARVAGKFAGCVTADEQLAKTAADLGYQVLAGGSDAAFLGGASQQKLQSLRGILGQSD